MKELYNSPWMEEKPIPVCSCLCGSLESPYYYDEDLDWE